MYTCNDGVTVTTMCEKQQSAEMVRSVSLLEPPGAEFAVLSMFEAILGTPNFRHTLSKRTSKNIGEQQRTLKKKITEF